MANKLEAIKAKLAKIEAQRNQLLQLEKEAERLERQAALEADRKAQFEIGRLITASPALFLSPAGWTAVSAIISLGERPKELADAGEVELEAVEYLGTAEGTEAKGKLGEAGAGESGGGNKFRF
jgi:hypothetical protein